MHEFAAARCYIEPALFIGDLCPLRKAQIGLKLDPRVLSPKTRVLGQDPGPGYPGPPGPCNAISNDNPK